MHRDLFYESFFFCSRDDLERLQPLSQSLLNMIVHGSNVLPLRPIGLVACYEDVDTIQIFVEEPATDGVEADYEASVHEGDFAETFRRLQHTCIKSFSVDVCDSPFLRYWKAQETAAFTVVIMRIVSPETTQYDVVGSIVNHLRPRTTGGYIEWHEDGDNDEELAIMARDSFLKNLQTCRLRVEEKDFPPPTFFFNEPGYPNYEFRCYHSQVADGIDGFIESFVRDGCANKRLESVYIKWHETERDDPSPAPKQLSKPTKIDLPLPETDLTASLTCDDDNLDSDDDDDSDGYAVSQCEMHSFVNTKQWQRMEVYKWSAVFFLFDRRTTHILQCRVKNL